MNDSAKFVLSKRILLKQFGEIQKHADVVSYSAKTNYEVAKLLEGLTSCFFSVHSFEDLEKIKDKKRVWFLAQAWNEKELERLFSLCVENFVVDNQKDLDVLLNNCKKKINILLRMRLKEHTVNTGKHFVYGFFSHQVNKLIPELRKNSSIKKLGIHFHRKTQNISEWSLKEELEQVLDKKVLESIDIVNMGGGIPVKYKNFNAEVLDSIFSEIKTLRSWLKKHDISLIIEAGRFIAAPSIKLVATIRNIYDNNIIVNCSVYNSSMDTFISHIRLEVENELEKGESFTIKGQTPCSMDIFRYRVFLKNPKVGDKITFLNAGAYNFTSDFCSLKKLETEIID